MTKDNMAPHLRMRRQGGLSGTASAIKAAAAAKNPPTSAGAATSAPAEVTTSPPATSDPVTTTPPAAPATTTPPVAQTTTAPPAVTTTTSAPVVASTTPAVVVSSSTTPAARTSTTSTPALASTTARIGSTTVVVVGQTFGAGGLSSTSSSSASSGTSLASGSTSGASTTATIGIVAGSVVGVIVLGAIIAYGFRRYFCRRESDDGPSPFDKDDFRRESVMLDDQYDNNEMSQYSNGAPGGGLGRSNTVLPGLRRDGSLSTPHPPSTIGNHFRSHQQQQQAMPSFTPGQIVPTALSGGGMRGMGGRFSPPAPQQAMYAGAYGAGNGGGMELYGGYPVAAGQHAQLDRGLYGAEPQYQHQPQPIRQAHPYSAQALERAASNASSGSNASSYARGTTPTLPLALAPRAVLSPSRSHAQSEDGDALSLVAEESEPTFSRSGTPVHANVQQSYFSSGRNASVRSQRAETTGGRTSRGTALPSYYEEQGEGMGASPFADMSFGETGERKQEHAREDSGVTAEWEARKLSVTNHGVPSEEDPYGGIA